jgi:hypothetical protein
MTVRLVPIALVALACTLASSSTATGALLGRGTVLYEDAGGTSCSLELEIVITTDATLGSRLEYATRPGCAAVAGSVAATGSAATGFSGTCAVPGYDVTVGPLDASTPVSIHCPASFVLLVGFDEMWISGNVSF